MDKPYLVFTQIEPEGSPYRANTASFWKREALMDIPRRSVSVGTTENQRLIFKKDTYETISEAWAQLPTRIFPHASTNQPIPNLTGTANILNKGH